MIEIDPLVEAVIKRCIERLPEDRPATALEVAVSLPGGDPLQAALAAGKMPSPEMVAAASEKGALPPLLTVACLVSFFMGLALIVLLSKQVLLHNLVPLENSPEVLADRSATIVQKLGYAEPATDRGYGFSYNFRRISIFCDRVGQLSADGKFLNLVRGLWPVRPAHLGRVGWLRVLSVPRRPAAIAWAARPSISEGG